MRPGGSSTSRIEPSGSMLAPATTSSRRHERAEPLDDDISLADECIDQEGLAADRAVDDHVRAGPGFVDGMPSTSARSETGTGCPSSSIIRRPSAWRRVVVACDLGHATRCKGNANRWPAVSTSRQRRTASVIGTMMRNSLPTPGRGTNLDTTSGRLDARTNGVETDATTGDVRHELRRREAGPEDQLECLVVVEVVDIDASPDRLRPHPLDVDAAAVVADGDDDLRSELHRVQSHRRLCRLARRGSPFGRFDAVIDGVADEVEQGIRELVQHPAIQLRVLAAHFPADVLAQALWPRRAPARWSESVIVETGTMRVRMTPSCSRFSSTRQLGELREVGGVDAEAFGEHPADSQVRRSRLADHAHQLVEALDRHHHRRRCFAWPTGAALGRHRRGRHSRLWLQAIARVDRRTSSRTPHPDG